MKLYVWRLAPNPRRTLIFLAEKGIDVATEDVGGEGSRLKPDYLQRYPQATVPMLELDDGTQIGEAMAICRYFETVQPDPPLMGTDAKDKAIVEMWERRAYEEGLVAVAEIFRNQHPMFAGRSLPGSADPLPQIPELIDRGRWRVGLFFRKFDRQLADRPFVAGDRLTVADATTLSTVDFARVVGVKIPQECPNLVRWHAEVSARPSAKVGFK
jgi:glutathione S-transferase